MSNFKDFIKEVISDYKKVNPIEWILVTILLLIIMYFLPRLFYNEEEKIFSYGYDFTIGTVHSYESRPSGTWLQYFANGKVYTTAKYSGCLYFDLPYGYPFMIRYAHRDNSVSQVVYGQFPSKYFTDFTYDSIIYHNGIISNIIECKSGLIYGEEGIVKYKGIVAEFMYYGSKYKAYRFIGENENVKLHVGDSCQIKFFHRRPKLGIIYFETDDWK